MKVLVIGATGATGSIAVRLLLEAGHQVTAFVRDPAKFTVTHERLRVSVGDARDAASLDAAVAGQDAVLAAFGPRSLKRDDLQEAFNRNLSAAMRKQGVRRLVNLSAMGAGDSRPQAPWLFRSVILPLFLKHAFADKERGEAVLFDSGLDLVNVRPGRLLNSPSKGPLRASLDPRGLSSMATREDLAAFMVGQLDKPDWVGKSPLVGY
ncbi:MAG TPA: NAD(P)H-binding protein [bacterium]|jgi:uncharacterized protein YbjT (DUF2867 family)|nr:NAD(P)H-binding protein [bacterium]